MNKLILTPILVLVLAVAARAQLYDNGLIVNRSNLISNWQMPTVITAGGAYTGVSGVFEHRGPSVRTLVNDGIYRTTGSHTDKFMGPGGQPGAQEIAGTNRPLFRNLQLVNGANQAINITIPAGISVSQSLTFANGITTTLRSYTQAGAIVLGDSASYTGGNTDAQHVNGYVSKIGSTSFTFPVGSGTDSRPLTISAPGAVTDHYSVAWIVGDPTTTTDPSGTPALHPVANREASLMAVSTIGQWDWIAVSGTGAGLTITVPLPDLTAFSAATDLRLVGWNGNQWINLSTGAKPYLNGTSYASGNADGSTLQGTMVAGITAIGIGGAPTISLSGTIFDDGNGLTDNLVNQISNGPNPLNGTDIDPTMAGNQALYATLVNTTTAVATVAVTNTGTYSFTDVAAGTYSVVLSTNASGSTIASLPANWVNTGEQAGTTPGSDGTPNGILTGVMVGSAAVGQANFGIDKKPEAANGAVAVQANPGGANQAAVFATAFTGSDLEDGPYANNLTGRPVSLSAATGGTLYYQGSAVATATEIASFDPTKVTVDPTATNETVVSFAFTVKDNAGVVSTPKTIAVPFYDNDDDDDNDEDDTDDDDDGDNDDDGEQDDRVKLPENTFKLIIPGPIPPIIGIFIPSFPFGILTLIVNGTVYTKDTFPPEGIIVRTDKDGDLLDDVIVEPIDPDVPPSIPFVAIDPTGKPVTTPGTATATPASLTSSGPLSCTATSVTLTATGGGNTYRFSPGATPASGSSTATVTTAGVYSVTVTGANGYEARASTRVTADQNAPTAGLTNSGPLSCTTASVTLTATGGGLYRFSAGATQLNNGPTATVSSAGVYSVTVTGANGCTATASTTVTVNGGSLLAFTNQPASASTVTLGAAVTASVGVSGAGSVTYQWYKDNVGNAVVSQTSAVLSLSNVKTSDAGRYFVIVTGTCNSLTSTAFTLTVIPVPDLTPILYARPTTLYGSADVSVVVNVVEVNEVATDQDITLYIAKTASVPLSFDANATEVGGRRVQNSLWRFNGVINANFYVLTSSQRIAGGGQLSVGLTGMLRAGATSGVLTINSVLLGGSGGEVRVNNNSDADKIEYFQR